MGRKELYGSIVCPKKKGTIKINSLHAPLVTKSDVGIPCRDHYCHEFQIPEISAALRSIFKLTVYYASLRVVTQDLLSCAQIKGPAIETFRLYLPP